MRVRKRFDVEKSEKLDKILRFGPFFRSPGAAEMAVDFQELPVQLFLFSRV